MQVVLYYTTAITTIYYYCCFTRGCSCSKQGALLYIHHADGHEERIMRRAVMIHSQVFRKMEAGLNFSWKFRPMEITMRCNEYCTCHEKRRVYSVPPQAPQVHVCMCMYVPGVCVCLAVWKPYRAGGAAGANLARATQFSLMPHHSSGTKHKQSVTIRQINDL